VTRGQRSFLELADVLADIPAMVKTTRRARHLSLRAAAGQMGMAHSALANVERGGNYSIQGLKTILEWLDAGG
jgi:transcriptional regulator with XRE-family HTH domain